MAREPSSPTGEPVPVRLVVGLGNPGTRYRGTRHNIGFDLLDRLAAARGLTWRPEKKWQAEIARTADGRLVLAKPQTYMNLSGEAVRAIAAFHKFPPDAVLIAHDDVDLPLGRLRLRASGSAGGHNGLKSIIQHLGTDAFPRLKIGVGRAGEGAAPRRDMIDHVLGRFDPAEHETLEKTLATASDAVECALSSGLAAAMNRYNQNPETPKPPRPQPRRKPTETEDPSLSPEAPATDPPPVEETQSQP